jgi:DNA-binding NarL/FixJ family response regulator
MIRVLICDDQEMVREGLRVILDSEPAIEVVGVAEDGAAAMAQAARLEPDVILMDLRMPGTSGVQAIRAIRERPSAVPILVLTTYDADEWVFDAIRAGASGYLLKDTPRAELVRAIEDAAAGKAPLDPAVAGKVLKKVAAGRPAGNPAELEHLSQREVDVLRLLGRGYLNADIADALHLSEGTVRNYVSSILNKLGLADRTQAALFALRHGLTGR